jgi:hypothetical protein
MPGNNFGPRKDKISWQFRIVHAGSKMLNDLYWSPNTVKTVKFRRSK